MSEHKNTDSSQISRRHPVVEAILKVVFAIVIIILFAGFVIGVDKIIAIVKDFLMGL